MYSLFTLKDSVIITLCFTTFYLLNEHFKGRLLVNDELEMEIIYKEEQKDDRFRELLDNLN